VGERDGTDLHPTGTNEGVQVARRNADMPTELGVGDPPLGDQPPDEA
jgi:hypothetical protein